MTQRKRIVGRASDGVRILAPKTKPTHFTRKEIRQAIVDVTKALDRPVIYRGIKIDPIVGRRSPLARAIRDDLVKRLVTARIFRNPCGT